MLTSHRRHRRGRRAFGDSAADCDDSGRVVQERRIQVEAAARAGVYTPVGAEAADRGGAMALAELVQVECDPHRRVKPDRGREKVVAGVPPSILRDLQR